MSTKNEKNDLMLHDLYTTWLRRDIWTVEDFIYLLNGYEPFYDPYDDYMTERQEFLEDNAECFAKITSCIPTTLKPIHEGQYLFQYRFRHTDLIKFALKKDIKLPPLLKDFSDRAIRRYIELQLVKKLCEILSIVLEQAEQMEKYWLRPNPKETTKLPFNFKELLNVYTQVSNNPVNLKPRKMTALSSEVREKLKNQTGCDVRFDHGNPHGRKNMLVKEFPDLINLLNTNT